MQKQKAKFPEEFVSFGEILLDSNILIKKIQNAMIICKNCGYRFKVTLKREFLKMLCGCGCRLIYPKGPSGVYKTSFISSKQFKKGFQDEKNKRHNT